MDVMHERSAGLDVHKATIVACVRVVENGKVRRECRTFETTTAELEKLLAWLKQEGCSHVAMEATGVYWKPVWNILSDGPFELIVANAAHIKNVPGRKTDVNDAMWIADLVSCGLIKASFIPEEAIQELRSLLRERKQLTNEQTRYVQRMQKTLEEANIKLDSVISEIMGQSGRRMIEAMIAGVRDPQQLARQASTRIKASPQELRKALHGRITHHHRFMLELRLGQYDACHKAIGQIDQQIDAVITRMDEKTAQEVAAQGRPFRALIELLCTVPGIGPLAATIILAEIGCDMGRFPTAGHLLAWAGLCPGQNESAGKRKSTRLRKGNVWLKTLLVQCAWAASRKNNSYYKAQFQRLRARRGPKTAICAVAASMLTAIYHMLQDGTQHQDLGADHFNHRSTDRQVRRLIGQLHKLGYQTELRPMPQAA